MFAKQLPKILENLGIKLDGDGKFTLNPLKKFEEGTLGGKRITGTVRGAVSGTVGMFTGAGLGAGISGAWRGLKNGKGWKETGKDVAQHNRQMRQARLDGSTFFGRVNTRVASSFGAPTQAEIYDGKIHRIDEGIKKLDNTMAPSKKQAEEMKLYVDAVSAMEKRAISKIEQGEAGVLSRIFETKKAQIETLTARLDELSKSGASEADLSKAQTALAQARIDFNNFLNDRAMKAYIDANSGQSVNLDGLSIDAIDIFGKPEGDLALKSMQDKMKNIVKTYKNEYEEMVDGVASELHSAVGKLNGMINDIQIANEELESQKRDLNEEKQQLYEQQRKAKANENAIK